MTQQELRNSLKAGHELHWYRIDKVLGQGGFGITYLAHDPNLDQHVAIKEYLPMELAVRDGDNSVYPASAANGDRYQWGLDRFISEARTLAKFKHPAIVRVLSVFEDNNTAYMVMEYEQGKSLQQLLEGRKTLSEQDLIPILAPLLDGLEMIHSTGFIHRDIKPANIYIRDDGSPVLLDFGSARQALGGQTKSLTSIVSPGYAPFEQYYSKGDRQGPWTDIYSLAATMYRAISGVMPMDAIDRSEAILKAERDVFVSVGEIGHGRYSPDFMRALDHALSFSEKKRPQSIAEWRAELGIESSPSGSVSRPASRALHSKTRFDVNSTMPEEIATQVAEPVIPSVRNTDVSGAPAPSAPRVGSVSAEVEYAARRRRKFAWWAGGVTTIALLVGVGLWSQSGLPQSSAIGDVAATLRGFISGDVGGRVDRLVAKGDRALSAGRAFEPLKGSAIDFYQQAIKLAPEHEGASQGIALISGRMVTATEEALASGEVALAEDYIQTLANLPEPPPGVAELEVELATAKAASAANAVQHERIQEFLNEAATDIAEGRILSPSGNNALVRYRAIQVLDPENADAKRGLEAIVARLTEEHEAAVATGDFALAGQRLRQIEPLHTDEVRFDALKSAFERAVNNNAAATARNTKISQLLKAAAVDLKANRLATPARGNALSRYKEVLAIAPANEQAIQGIAKIATRYVGLARGAIDKRNFDDARDYIARARSLDASSATVQRLSDQLKAAEAKAADENAAIVLAQERQRLAAEARQREEQERLRIELERAREAAIIEKRKRQELEAKRLFELEQNKHRGIEPEAAVVTETMNRSTFVVEIDGFDPRLLKFGLNASQVRSDIERRLQGLGYTVVPHHVAGGSSIARLFVVRFRANLNSASGVFSYAASLSLYDRVPATPNSVGGSSLRPIWDKGTTGVAVETQLRRVRDEYKRTMNMFAKEVGNAPGRL